MTFTRIAAKTLFVAGDLLLPRLTGPRILIYHQVGSGRTHEMNITVQAFRRQLDWMQSYGEIINLEDAIRRRGEPNSNRLFVLTFDDGYADVFANAFPLLQRRGIPFTLYLTSGPIESPESFQGWPGEPLTWQQVREMVGSGLVTVGAHTHSHRDLRGLAKGAIAEDLNRSNEIIQSRCDSRPRHFTYPWGLWSSEADPIVRATYRSATLGSGPAISGSSDAYTLHRLPIQRSDLSTLFRRKVRDGGRTENRIRRSLHAYAGP